MPSSLKYNMPYWSFTLISWQPLMDVDLKTENEISYKNMSTKSRIGKKQFLYFSFVKSFHLNFHTNFSLLGHFWYVLLKPLIACSIFPSPLYIDQQEVFHKDPAMHFSGGFTGLHGVRLTFLEHDTYSAKVWANCYYLFKNEVLQVNGPFNEHSNCPLHPQMLLSHPRSHDTTQASPSDS